jgi:hypothetical protein
MHSVFGRDITIHTAIYGVDIRFWPTNPTYYGKTTKASMVKPTLTG